MGSKKTPFMLGSKLESWTVRGNALMYRSVALTVTPPGISVFPARARMCRRSDSAGCQNSSRLRSAPTWVAMLSYCCQVSPRE